MYNTQDFKILTWDIGDNQFWWYTGEKWKDYEDTGEILLSGYLPLTESSKELIKMVYPDICTVSLEKALTCWGRCSGIMFFDDYLYYNEGNDVWR